MLLSAHLPRHRQIALADDLPAGVDVSGATAPELTGLVRRTLDEVHAPVPPALRADGGPPAVAGGSFVVDPPFFTDGDVGRVAVSAVVNELAAAGARPHTLALSLIVEAGLPLRQLRRVAESVRDAAREAAVTVSAVDTRVVRAGEADRVYVTATAFGQHRPGGPGQGHIRAGDRIVLSARLGGYAAHVLATREGLGFEVFVPSGCAPLNGLLTDVHEAAGPAAVRDVRALRGGGLAAVLRDAAHRAGLRLRIGRAALPVQYEARLTFDTLGADPLRVPDEGCLCLFLAPDAVRGALAALRAHPRGAHAAEIGEVTGAPGAAVELVGADGDVVRLQEAGEGGEDGAGGAAGPAGAGEPARLR